MANAKGFLPSVRRGRRSANETRVFTIRTQGHEPVTDRPIDLDGHRTVEGKIRSELRRKAVNRDTAPDARPITAGNDIDAALLVQPARTWIEAMEKAAFLLRRYEATREADDPRIQKLIKRAQSDLARLRKREETQP